MIDISYSSKFLRKAKKLPVPMKRQILKVEEKFRLDTHDPSLKTHKLTGELSNYYSFSVNYSHRIVFSIEKNGSVVFIDIGDHSIYQ